MTLHRNTTARVTGVRPLSRIPHIHGGTTTMQYDTVIFGFDRTPNPGAIRTAAAIAAANDAKLVVACCYLPGNPPEWACDTLGVDSHIAAPGSGTDLALAVAARLARDNFDVPVVERYVPIGRLYSGLISEASDTTLVILPTWPSLTDGLGAVIRCALHHQRGNVLFASTNTRHVTTESGRLTQSLH